MFVDPAPEVIGSYPPKEPILTPGQPSPYGGPVPPTFPPDLQAPPPREPQWIKNGTYMTVRASTFDAKAWDRRSLGEQEHVVGRFKVSGQPLDAPDDPIAPITDPNFGADPTGTITPTNSHIRKANPRGPGDEQRRIFRRGYPLVTAAGAGGVQHGLAFICFGRTITTQFEFITRAWTVNPDFPTPGTGPDRLREIETVLCGGYYFVPPLTNANHPWSFAHPRRLRPAPEPRVPVGQACKRRHRQPPPAAGERGSEAAFAPAVCRRWIRALVWSASDRRDPSSEGQNKGRWRLLLRCPPRRTPPASR